LQAEKVNHNSTGRPTERGMVSQSARHGKSAINKRRLFSHLRFALVSTVRFTCGCAWRTSHDDKRLSALPSGAIVLGKAQAPDPQNDERRS